jgi:hypothetical protein
VVVRPTDWEAARSGLLDANGYLALMQTQIDQELKETP